jgi:hypothetical protein
MIKPNKARTARVDQDDGCKIKALEQNQIHGTTTTFWYLADITNRKSDLEFTWTAAWQHWGRLAVQPRWMLVMLG